MGTSREAAPCEDMFTTVRRFHPLRQSDGCLLFRVDLRGEAAGRSYLRRCGTLSTRHMNCARLSARACSGAGARPNQGWQSRNGFVIGGRSACRSVFPGSSAVEQPAVNRLVAGSNPARGATSILSNSKTAPSTRSCACCRAAARIDPRCRRARRWTRGHANVINLKFQRYSRSCYAGLGMMQLLIALYILLYQKRRRLLCCSF
jgi:hypothetical protein